MTKKGFIVLFVTTLLIGMGNYGPARAESDAKPDPLIDRLIRKGILTEEEAEETRQEEAVLEKQMRQKEAAEIQDKGLELPKGLKGVKLGALWYLDYSSGDEPEYDLYIGGLAYDIYKGNLLLLAYETTDYGDDAGKKGKIPVVDHRLGDDHKGQAVMQIKF